MKNQLKTILVLMVALLLAPVLTHAQTILLPTTLSTAITTGAARTMVVVSGTSCIVGNNAIIDRELVEITSAPTTTTLGIRRGVAGTVGVPHVSGAAVVCSVPQAFGPTSFAKVDQNGNPTGSCTRNQQLYLPVFNLRFGTTNDCLGGTWVMGDSNNGAFTASRFRIETAPSGGTVYTSLNGTGTATIATEVYCSEVFVPTNKLLTGIALLAGTANSTDKHYVILYDSAGTALANSTVAGTTGNTTASAYQQYPFTQLYLAVGPAQYYACFQSNGTTDTVRMVVTGTQDNLLTKGQTGATFGTIPALTVPTTFTTAVGPYAYLY